MAVLNKKLCQAYDDAFGMLRKHATEGLHAPQITWLSSANYCPHVRRNSDCCGVLPTEEPVYNWSTVINSAVKFYFKGNIHQSLKNISKYWLIQSAVLQQKGWKGKTQLWLNTSMNLCVILRWHLVFSRYIKTKASFSLYQKTKQKLAKLWGKRKGNRKTMTYQKMARALRNYGIIGETTEIWRKLNFSEAILQRLFPSYFLGKEIFYSYSIQPDWEYLSLNNWNANYNYTYDNYLELSKSPWLLNILSHFIVSWHQKSLQPLGFFF